MLARQSQACSSIQQEILQQLGGYYTIYAGVKSKGLENGLFSKQDTMTLDVLKSTLPVTLPLEMSGKYYNRRDHNISRMVNSASPFIYDHNCRKFKDHSVALMLGLKSILTTPVTCETNPNYSFVINFYSTTATKLLLEELINHHKNELQCIANKLFLSWYNSEGGGFNIFHSRSVFCHRALEVAQQLANGYSTRETAEKLHISESGIQYHIDHLRKTLGARNRGHMLVELIRKGVIH